MYVGHHQTVLDDKGRITIPRKFRDDMIRNDHITWHMTRGYDANIVAYNREAWAALMSRLERLEAMDPRVQDLIRLTLGNAAQVRLDGQGRMAVPTHLRQLGGIEKEVVLVGLKDRLELWSKEAWDAYEASNAPQLKVLVTELFVRGEPTDQEKGGPRDAN